MLYCSDYRNFIEVYPIPSSRDLFTTIVNIYCYFHYHHHYYYYHYLLLLLLLIYLFISIIIVIIIITAIIIIIIITIIIITIVSEALFCLCRGTNIWPPPGGICFCRRLSVCLFVCLFVCNITQKVMDKFWWNFQGLIATLRSGTGTFLKGLGQRSRTKSIKRSNSLKWL